MPLRRLELVEVGFDPLACGSTALAVAALQIPRDLFPREHGPCDLVDHRLRSTIPDPAAQLGVTGA